MNAQDCKHTNIAYDRKARRLCVDCKRYVVMVVTSPDGELYGRPGVTYRRATPKPTKAERKAAKRAKAKSS